MPEPAKVEPSSCDEGSTGVCTPESIFNKLCIKPTNNPSLLPSRISLILEKDLVFCYLNSNIINNNE